MLCRTETDEGIFKTVKYFIQMVDVPEYFCMYLNSQHNLMFLYFQHWAQPLPFGEYQPCETTIIGPNNLFGVLYLVW